MRDVKKASMVVRVAVDDDGTPLCDGERMTEIRPGVWAHPMAAALAAYLEGKGT